MEKYELDWERNYPYSAIATVFAILTGLSYEELNAALPKGYKTGMRGQEFVEAARKMGFNVNPRWKKFDKDTPFPCILRMKSLEDPKQKYWWITVYYDGEVYQQGLKIPFDAYFEFNKELKITSMLQVWI